MRLSTISTEHRMPRLVAAAIIALLVAGAFLTSWVVQRTEREMQETFLLQSRLIADAVHGSDVQAFSGSAADLDNPAYLRLKEQLSTVQQAGDEYRFIYLLGRTPEGELFIFVDSEPPESEDYSPPGDLYPEASPEFHHAFLTGNEIVAGPYRDRWGTWVTALIPIVERPGDQPIAVLGMDAAAGTWNRELAFAALPTIITTLTLILMVLVGTLLIRLRGRLEVGRQGRLHHLDTVLVVAVGLAVTLLATLIAHQNEEYSQHHLFAQLAVSRTDSIADTLRDLRDTELESLGNFFEGSEEVTAQEFRAFTTHLTTNPAVLSWQWIPAVPAAEKSSFEAQVRGTGILGFHIWEFDDRGIPVATADRNWHYPVLLVAPDGDGAANRGYDLGSDPVLLEALEQAWRTRLTTASRPTTKLWRPESNQPTLFIFRPVFDRDQPTELVGFTTAVLPATDLLHSVGRDETTSLGIAFLHTDGVSEALAADWEMDEPPSSRPSLVRPVFAFGKVLTIHARADDRFMALQPPRDGWIAALVGTQLTVVLAIVITLLLRRRSELERLVAERTTQMQQSESKYRALFEQSSDAISIVAPDGLTLEVNKAWLDLFGYQSEDVPHITAHDIYVNPSEREDFLKRAAESPVVRDEVRFKRKNGQVFDCQRTVVVRKDREGRTIAFMNVLRDVTHERQRERALLESEARYRALFEQSMDAISVSDVDGRSIVANEAWLKMFGYEAGDLPHIEAKDIYVDFSQREAMVKRIDAAGFTRQEVRFKRKDGTVFDCERTVVALTDTSGELIGYQSVNHDITARKRAEQALRESEERYRALFEQSMDAISIVALDGRNIEVNQRWLDLFGYEVADVPSIRAIDVYADPADRELFLRRIEETGFVEDEVRFKRKDGTAFDCERTVVALKDASGELIGYQSVNRDITERKRAEQALRESEGKYRELFEQSRDAIAVVAVDGTLLDANPAYWRLLGIEPAEPGSINVRSHYVDPSARDAFVHRMERDGVVIDDEQHLVRPDGTVIDCLRTSVARRDERGRIIAYQTVLRDITERKKAERALRQSEELMRELAAHLEVVREEERTGIARELHDQVGQALTALRMDLSRAVESLGRPGGVPPESLAEMISLVDATSDDVRRISSELRPGILDDIGLVPAMEWQLGQFQARMGITCVLEASSEDDVDRSTSTALYRVLQELLTNVARHAAASNVRVTFESRDGRYVLQVMDNGRGITRDEAHSPASLGLVGIRERLRPLGGSIEFDGVPGKGTTVTVTVPVR